MAEVAAPYRSPVLRGALLGPLAGLACGMLWHSDAPGVLLLMALGLVCGAGLGWATAARGRWPLPLLGPLFPPWYGRLYVWSLRSLWAYAILLPAGLAWHAQGTLAWVEALRPALQWTVSLYEPLQARDLASGLDPATAAIRTHGYAVGIVVLYVLVPLGWHAVLSNAPAALRVSPGLARAQRVAVLIALGAGALLGLGTCSLATRPDWDGGVGTLGSLDARALPLPFSLLSLHVILIWLLAAIPAYVLNARRYIVRDAPPAKVPADHR